MRKSLVVFATMAVTGCSLISSLKAGTPLTQAEVQQDLANATYLMKAAGCAVAGASATAAPIIQVSGDAQGNQILAAVSAGGAIACQLTVPATALPVPAQPNAPAATAVVPAS